MGTCTKRTTIKPIVVLFVCLTQIYALQSCMTGLKTGGSIQANYTNVSVLQEADKLYEKGQIKTALLKYSSYVNAPFPNKNQKYIDYARFQLANCYYQLGQYQDARHHLSVLLNSKTDTEYKEPASQLLALSNEKIDQENRAISEEWNNLLRQISEMEELVKENPDSAEVHFKLADLYWRAGNYQQALDAYKKTLMLNPDYQTKSVMRDRIRITENGEIKMRDSLLTPEDSKPVKVVGVRREVFNRSDYLGQYEYLRLSGFVENQGLYDVRNVKVEVSIFDFFNKVLSTKTIHIGNLKAGQKRPFAFLFNELDFSGLAGDISKWTADVYYDEPNVTFR